MLQKGAIIKDRTLKSIVTAAVEIVILMLLVIFLGGPLSKYSKSLKKEFDVKQKELKRDRELMRKVPNPQKEINKIREGMNELHKRAVSRKELPRIIQQLVKKSSELNIEIVSIKPIENVKETNTKLPQGVSKAYIKMIIKCPYQTLGDYLKALNSLPIIFTIEGIFIEKIEEIDSSSPNSKSKKKKSQDIFTTLILSTYTIWQVE